MSAARRCRRVRSAAPCGVGELRPGLARGRLVAHGAEADTVATVEVFAGQLARYGELALEVDALHDVSNAVNNGFVDLSRRFSWRDNEPVFNFGKLKGKSLRWAASEPTERTYMRWILDGNFEEDTKLIIREALSGKIRQRMRGQPRDEG